MVRDAKRATGFRRRAASRIATAEMAMSYGILVTLHLFGALIFVGTVFFEVAMLEDVRRRMSVPVFREVEQAIGERARRLMPWVLFVLYSAGVAMAWRYRAALAHPFDSSFATLLTLKILLAFSVLGHFIRAMTWFARRQMTQRRMRVIHLSVFCHVVGIVLLAKAMFYARW